MHNSIRFILAGLLATGMVACAKKVKEEPTPVSDAVAPVETAPVDGAGRYSATDLDRVPCLMQRVVYFDFDRAEIRGEAQEILRCHAKYLNDNATSLYIDNKNQPYGIVDEYHIVVTLEPLAGADRRWRRRPPTV